MNGLKQKKTVKKKQFSVYASISIESREEAYSSQAIIGF